MNNLDMKNLQYGFDYTINQNEDEVKEITDALKANDWYCPCALEKNEDTKCMCKYFREEVQVGESCHCGLYTKVKNALLENL